MRVPNLSLYTNSTYRLGNLTNSLKNANEIVSTQKKINEISDDPLGLSQVLSMKSFLGNLEQIGENVTMGKTWLETGENALDGVNALILEAKTQATRLANDSITADERNDAIEQIENIINQIVSLGNTQVNGSYIFSGTDTDIIPLKYDTQTGGGQVLYMGNNLPFEVRTDKNSGVQVGRDGKQTFWDTDIEINSTNNTIVFKEDNGHGSASEIIMEAVIPDGLYTKKSLQTAIRNALNEASGTNGYGLSYVTEYDEDTQLFSIREDGTYNGYIKTEFLWETGEQAYINQIQVSGGINPDDVSVSVVQPTALTIGTIIDPDDPAPLRFKWNKADRQWEVQNNPGYVMPAAIDGTADAIDIDLDEDGISDINVRLEAPAQHGDYIQFEIIPAKGDHSAGHEIGFVDNNLIYAPPASDSPAQFITDLVITGGVNDTIIFEEVNSAGVATTMTADINVTTSGATYTDMAVLAKAIETEMEAESLAFGNAIDYAVSYDPENSRFNIREDGSNLNELSLLWSASTASAATTLGYYTLDDTITYPHSSITINSQNNILDFSEENPPGTFSTLQARIPTGDYDDMSDLAAAVETAMENASLSSGNTVTYSVTYNQGTDQFEIIRSAGAAITSVSLLWNSGSGADYSIGETLGYDPGIDDIGAGLAVPYASDIEPVMMSLFSTAIDATNNMLDFEEINTSGVATTISAQIESGTYNSVRDLETAVESAMNYASAKDGNNVTYDVSYDEGTNRFQIQRSGGTTLSNLNLLWASGPNLGHTIVYNLGYGTSFNDTGGGILGPYTGDTDPVWMSFDAGNNTIDFQEIDIYGTVSNEMAIQIPEGDYTSPAQVASEIELALSNASPNSVDYTVLYDSEKGFLIKGSSSQISGFELLWNTGDNTAVSAAQKLGFSTDSDISVGYAQSDQAVVNITIDASNNKLDFKEIVSQDDGMSVSQLTAVIDPKKSYTSHSELAAEIEEAMELESRQHGNTIDYTVTYDAQTQKFTIKENGTRLDQLQLLWNSGDNAPLAQGGSGQSIGAVIGFNGDSDDISSAMQSTRGVEWGIFNTLLDLKQYLADNDRDGIERSIGRLELNYDNMTSKIVDIGMKYSRLEVRETITSQVSLNVTERRSSIEDADIIQSILDLKSIETAYQAALNSTSSILNVSLVDYL